MASLPLTDEEVCILMNLVISAKAMTRVTQPNRDLEDKLSLIYDKLDDMEFQ